MPLQYPSEKIISEKWGVFVNPYIHLKTALTVLDVESETLKEDVIRIRELCFEMWREVLNETDK